MTTRHQRWTLGIAVWWSVAGVGAWGLGQVPAVGCRDGRRPREESIRKWSSRTRAAGPGVPDRGAWRRVPRRAGVRRVPRPGGERVADRPGEGGNGRYLEQPGLKKEGAISPSPGGRRPREESRRQWSRRTRAGGWWACLPGLRNLLRRLVGRFGGRAVLD